MQITLLESLITFRALPRRHYAPDEPDGKSPAKHSIARIKINLIPLRMSELLESSAAELAYHERASDPDHD
jgi:hypothetical protein